MIPSGAERAARGEEASLRRVSEDIRRQVSSDPQGSVDKARRALSMAKREKREAQRHRRRASAAMLTYNEFKRELEALGIAVVFEPGPVHKRKQSPMPEGGTSDTRNSNSRRN